MISPGISTLKIQTSPSPTEITLESLDLLVWWLEKQSPLKKVVLMVMYHGRIRKTNHLKQTQVILIYLGVSKNRGTPKSSILIGFSIINHPFWGTPIFGNGNTHFKTPPKIQTCWRVHLNPWGLVLKWKFWSPTIEQQISILLWKNPAIFYNGYLNQERLGDFLNMTLEKIHPLEDVSPIFF